MTKTARKRGDKPRNAKKGLLRKTMLEAAARLFAEKGFGGTNLQDISAALGISRPALYYYFESKEDILASLVDEVTVFTEHQSGKVAANPDFNPAETLRQMVLNHALWLLSHPVQFRVLDRTESDLPATARRTHEKSKRAVLNNFTRSIERGVELGHFRPVDARVAAFTLIGMCSWTAWWFHADGKLSPDDVAKMIADLAVNGIRRVEATQPRELQIADAIQNLQDDLVLLEKLIKKSGKAS